MNNSIFKNASKDTCNLIKTMNQNKEPTFVLPTKYVSKEAAQVGYLLHEISNKIRNKKEKTTKNFFCNSSDEALQGAIKIMRHFGYKEYKKHQGKIVIYSPNKNMYQQLNNNLNHENGRLYPGVKFIDNLQHIQKYSQEENILAIIFIVTTTHNLEEINLYLTQNKNKNTIIGLDLSIIPVSDLGKIKVKSNKIDVIIWGEELTNREIPFGAFSMTNKLHKPWNSIINCLMHSSTYSGNILSLRKLLEHVLNSHNTAGQYKENIKKIGQSYKVRKEYFANYVNPKLIKLYKMTGYDFDVIKAQGSYFTVQKDNKKYEVFDCVGGGGLSIFGHNPEDLNEKVINKHDVKTDYVKKLTLKLKDLTGYDHFFPSVSGASAVESAITMALMAQSSQKQKVLVFKNNYAGKLLLPLIGSKIDSDKYFHPLYNNIVTIDPFSKNASKEIKMILNNNNIGLIWFEYIRGLDAKKIPLDIINIIKENRQKYGYYVGVDEILCGMCRTGPFMSIQATDLQPDVTTLSKGLSYMTFPVGGALIKDKIEINARKNNKNMVSYLKNRYVNQIGAHIAYHCLNRIEEEAIAQNVINRSKQLEDKIKNNVKKSASIQQDGLFFSIILKEPWWTKLGVMSELLKTIWLLKLVKKWLIIGGIFTFFDTRLFPRLNINNNECCDLTQRINGLLKN